jgi:hypothetical protein
MWGEVVQGEGAGVGGVHLLACSEANVTRFLQAMGAIGLRGTTNFRQSVANTRQCQRAWKAGLP